MRRTAIAAMVDVELGVERIVAGGGGGGAGGAAGAQAGPRYPAGRDDGADPGDVGVGELPDAPRGVLGPDRRAQLVGDQRHRQASAVAVAKPVEMAVAAR